ncbi:MAG: hypothetical protein L3K00_07675 [Thermoplasmata archaeon]|nr:hypothetical protein [Thermoplasmata archaeon]
MAEPEPTRSRLDLTTWAGIGIVGLLVFLVGVYQPIWAHVKYGPWISIAVAIVGGIVVAIGFGYAYDAREESLHPTRRPPPEDPDAGSIRAAPSFEIYRPGEDDVPESEKR